MIEIFGDLRASSVVLDLFDFGLLLLDEGGRPSLMNEAAKPYFAVPPQLYLDARGVLRSRHRKLDHALKADSLTDRAQQAAQVVCIDQDDGSTVCAWLKTLLVSDDESTNAAQSSPPRAIMLMRDQPRDIPAELIVDLLDISPAEGRLIRSLIAGKPLKQVASDADLSYKTARNHLSSAMRKTNVKSQADLMAKVHRRIAPIVLHDD